MMPGCWCVMLTQNLVVHCQRKATAAIVSSMMKAGQKIHFTISGYWCILFDSRSFYRLFPELLYAWILLKTVMRTVVKVVLVIEWIEKTSVSIAKSFRFIWNFSAWTVLFWDITHSGVPVISLETVCWIKLYSKESDVMFSVSNNTDVCACTISVRFKLCVSFNCSDDIYVYVYLF